MGLKQMVEAANAAIDSEQETLALPPIDISGEAYRAYALKMREWTGWPNARLTFGDPMPVSPFASCNPETRECIVNPETLILNPNRVLLTVTPFRMRQEAVLTGAMLHEAGHARHTRWLPRTNKDAATFAHADGTPVTKAEVALARTMEEARVEGLIAAEADDIGATGLAWTLRASAAHLLEPTSLSPDPDQAVMDVITSWALRAGRQHALAFHVSHRVPDWVGDFTSLMHETVLDHCMADDPNTGNAKARAVQAALISMASSDAAGLDCDIDTDSTMVDRAKSVLTMLFPETPPEDMPMSGGGCGESGEQGEGQPQPGAGQAAGEGESGDQTEGDPEGDPEAGEGAAGAGEERAEGEGASDSAPDVALANALRDMEAESKDATEDETTEAAANAGQGGQTGGAGGQTGSNGGWRQPSPQERDIQKGAERFLRGLIEPTERAKVTLDEAPSATVDGAALAAWKAGGQVRDPHFFKRTRRETEPAAPAKIAILVDVSASMDSLQKPSAVLSWALATAALDLRNFAGRGVQVESCLIHWGSSARVVQKNGRLLPGIREVDCYQGTSAMASAFDLVEEEMPGFFDLPDKPVNRLIVQFTDWDLGGGVRETGAGVHRLLENGVNMLTVAPPNYNVRRSNLGGFLSQPHIQRGKPTLMKYNPMFPEQVWEQAVEALA